MQAFSHVIVAGPTGIEPVTPGFLLFSLKVSPKRHFQATSPMLFLAEPPGRNKDRLTGPWTRQEAFSNGIFLITFPLPFVIVKI